MRTLQIDEKRYPVIAWITNEDRRDNKTKDWTRFRFWPDGNAITAVGPAITFDVWAEKNTDWTALPVEIKTDGRTGSEHLKDVLKRFHPVNANMVPTGISTSGADELYRDEQTAIGTATTGGGLIPCFIRKRTSKPAERDVATAKAGPDAGAMDPEPAALELSDRLIFRIAMECNALDENTRKSPGHWAVFLAAWKDGQSPYEMERRRGWKRKTAAERLLKVEREILNGNKVASLQFDGGILHSVEDQIDAAHEHGRNVYRPALAD